MGGKDDKKGAGGGSFDYNQYLSGGQANAGSATALSSSFDYSKYMGGVSGGSSMGNSSGYSGGNYQQFLDQWGYGQHASTGGEGGKDDKKGVVLGSVMLVAVGMAVRAARVRPLSSLPEE